MNKNRIKLIVSLLCVLALLVGCSNTNASIKNDLSNQVELMESETLPEDEVAEEIEEEYEYVTVSLLSNAGSEIKTYETILQDGISYVLIDDFVDLCYRVSEYDHYIENIDISKIDEDILSVEYNPDAKYFIFVELKAQNAGWTMNTKNEYDNLIKNINIAKTIYDKIEINELYYLPVNLIQYEVYNGCCDLYILNDNEYIIQDKNRSTNEFFSEIELSDEINYINALEQLKTLINIDTLDKNIDDYTEYTIERGRMMITYNDGHYTDLIVVNQNIMDMDRIQEASMNPDIVQSEYMQFEQAKIQNEVYSDRSYHIELIDEDTVYVRISNFTDDNSLISSLNYATKDFNEDKKYNFVIDLRDNAGGFLTKGFEFVETIANGPIYFDVALVNDSLRVERSYEFIRTDEKYKNYDIDVLVNEYTISCGVLVAEIMAKSFDADIYGVKPVYDDLSVLAHMQFPDRSICTISDLNAEHKTWEELGIVVQDISEYDMIDLESLEANE